MSSSSVLPASRFASRSWRPYTSTVPAVWLGRPGAWKCAPKCSFATPFGGTVKYILAVLEAAVQWVVDVVGLGHVHREVGGRAEPVAAGEEQLPPGRQVVGAHDVPRVRRSGQGVAVHAHSRGVRDQDHAAAAAGANRLV